MKLFFLENARFPFCNIGNIGIQLVKAASCKHKTNMRHRSQVKQKVRTKTRCYLRQSAATLAFECLAISAAISSDLSP